MIGYRLFDSEPLGNIFYLHAAIFGIKREFYNKTTCSLRGGCFNRDLSVVIPV